MAASAVAVPVPLQLRIHTLRRTGVVSRRCRMPVRLFRRCRQISSGPGAAVRLNRPFGIPNGTGPQRPVLCNCHCIGYLIRVLLYIYGLCRLRRVYSFLRFFVYALIHVYLIHVYARVHRLRPNESTSLYLFCSPAPAFCTFYIPARLLYIEAIASPSV